MLSTLRLAAKISLGYAVILLLTLGVCGWLAWAMYGLQEEAVILAEENSPALAATFDVQDSWGHTMDALDQFALTRDEESFADAARSLEKVKKDLEAARILAKEHARLKLLGEEVAKIEVMIADVERLMGQSRRAVVEIAQTSASLDKSADAFMRNVGEYLANQDKVLREEIAAKADPAAIAERAEKVKAMNEVLDLGNAIRVTNWKSQARRDPRILQNIDRSFDELERKVRGQLPLTRQEANRRQLELVISSASDYREGIKTVAADIAGVNDIQTRLDALGDQIRGEARSVAEQSINEVHEGAVQTAAVSSSSVRLIVISLVLMLLLGTALAVVITREITRPINKVIEGLSANGEQVASASNQVAASSQQMANGASEQASSLEEVSSSLEEVTSMARQNAESARQANSMAREASGAASRGGEAMGRMSQAMEQIRASAAQTAKILKTIDEIAFQTNLLALNAAVEAARAGEAGKGFAVVAEEVRGLAQRSAEAAKTTAQLIEESQRNAENGATASAEVESILTKVVTDVGSVSRLIGEVASASTQQTSGIEQINTAIGQMDTVTQSNAANAEESASASEELSAQAVELNEMVNALIRLVNGNEAASAFQSTSARHGASRAADHTALKLAQMARSRGGNNHRPASVALVKDPAAAGEKRPDPEQVIPLGDAHLSDF